MPQGPPTRLLYYNSKGRKLTLLIAHPCKRIEERWYSEVSLDFSEHILPNISFIAPLKALYYFVVCQMVRRRYEMFVAKS